MPKMTLDRDSMWPVYYIGTDPMYPGHRTVEIPTPLYRKYKRIIEQFGDMQDRLEWIYKENNLDETIDP